MTKTHPFYDVAIIGSGLAGCAAAHHLAEAGLQIVIVDKGRRVGGRVSTKRADGFLFNHGAQFLTAKSDLFRAQILQAEKQGHLAAWQEKHQHIRYSGTADMRGFMEMLAEKHSPLQGCEIEQITADPTGITLSAKDGRKIQAQHFILTAPAPQTARLLHSLHGQASQLAQSAHYHPCWTVMLGYQQPHSAMLPNGLECSAQPATDIAALSLEQSRPEAEQSHTAITIQANERFSTEHLEEKPDKIIAMLKSQTEKILQHTLPVADYQSAHRWRFAKVMQPVPPESPRLFSLMSGRSHFALAGDWIPCPASRSPATGQRAEEAFLSGHHAAADLLNVIQQQ